MVEVQEYKRTCNTCGKVWHSLVSREREIESRTKIYGMQECFACCDRDARAQYSRNQDSSKGELDRVRSCPDCHSTNYSEEVLTYEK